MVRTALFARLVFITLAQVCGLTILLSFSLLSGPHHVKHNATIPASRFDLDLLIPDCSRYTQITPTRLLALAHGSDSLISPVHSSLKNFPPLVPAGNPDGGKSQALILCIRKAIGSYAPVSVKS